MSKITKHWDDAGSRPGQKQDLEIEFVSRSGNSVKIKWELKVKSNGTDNYDYSTRHNSARIYHPKDTRVSTETYQAKGYKASRTVSDTFTLNNIGNETDKIDFWYKNKRIWVKHTDAEEPRSTGVVDKTHVGTLSIPKNSQYDMKFIYVVSDTKKTYSCWHSNNFTIPRLSPSSNTYTFQGWTEKKYSNNLDSIKKASASIYAGNIIKNVTSNHTYYAVWRPRMCDYKFLDYSGGWAYTESHTYGSPNTMKNLDTAGPRNNVGRFRIPGYSFDYWEAIVNGISYTYKAGNTSNLWPPNMSSSSVIVFKSYKKPDPNTLKFNFLNNNLDVKIFDKNNKNEAYYTDSKFDMSRALMSVNGKNFTDITAKPGYKLIGWSTTPLSIAQPTKGLKPGNHRSGEDKKATKNFVIYPASGEINKFNYSYFNDHTLNLYAYYEYYTTSYVYTKDGWKLAMPYVYTKDGWKMALSYIYTKDGWKL